ncbi:MAG: SDR family NAD(P)-dependent oxidoreductase, partial [Clostridia bacterium]
MKTVIISGASRGIGAAIAKKLAKDGFFVVINFLSNKNAALAVLEECNNCGMIWQADVSKPDQVEAMVNAVVKKCGSVDALVNNAGISKSGLLIDMT